MKKPLITVVTITFNLIKNNRVKTFKQCVESVQKQSYPHIEHLIIDGNSSDGTKEILKKYEKKGWIRFISESDKGVYDAMNRGILLSKGKYITFLNSDDFYHNKSGIKTTINGIEKHNAVFSYAPVTMIDADENKLSFYHPQMNPNSKNVFFTMPFCHQTMFFKKDVMLNKYMFDDSFKSAGDYDLVLRMCLNNLKSIKIKKNFVTFRFTGMSSSNTVQSLKEVSRLYFKNYSKLSNIKRTECKDIYDNGYLSLPFELAVKLRNNRYFDFDLYIRSLENIRKQYKENK